MKASHTNDVFVSYSRRDRALADHLQRALEQYERPLLRRRAIEVFRDESRLKATPELLRSIKSELDSSRKMIVLASHASKLSTWVDKEVRHWLDTKDDSLYNLLPVIIEGEVGWDASTDDFVRKETSPLPDGLHGVYSSEPMYLDLTWLAETPQDQYPDLGDERFRSAVVRIVAFIRETSPEEVESDAVDRQRRSQRMAGLAAFVALVLVAAVAGAFLLASRNATIASEEADDAIAQELLRESTRLIPQDPALAMILAAEATGYLSLNDSRLLGAMTAARESLDRSGNPLAVHIETDGIATQLVFSPDDEVLAALLDDGSVHFWHGRTGEPLASPIPAGTSETAIGFAEEGIVAVGRTAESLQIDVWALGSGDGPVVSSAIDGAFVAHIVSPDGALIAAIHRDGKFQLYDRQSKVALAEFVLTDATLNGGQPLMSFGGGSDALAVFNMQSRFHEEVIVWTESKGMRVFAYPNGIGLAGIDINTENDALATAVRGNSGGRGGGIGRWFLDSSVDGALTPFGFEEVVPHSFWEVASTEDGSLLAAGTDSGGLQLWNYRTFTEVGDQVEAHKEWISDLTFNHMGDVVASAGADKTVALWRRGQPAEKVLFPTHPEANRVALGGRSEVIATGSVDGSVKIWSVRSPEVEPVDVVGLDGTPIGGVAISPTSDFLAIGAFDSLTIAEVSTGTALWTSSISAGYLYGLQFTADGSRLFGFADDGKIRQWDTESGALLGEYEAAGSGAIELDLSADGSRMVSLHTNEEVVIWDLTTTLPEALQYEGGARLRGLRSVKLSDDGSELFGINGVGYVQRFGIDDMLVSDGETFGRATTFNADLEYISGLEIVATLDGDGTIRAWGAGTGTEVATAIRPAESQPGEYRPELFFDLAASDDGSTVIAAGLPNSVHVWHSWSVGDSCEVASLYVSRLQVEQAMAPIGISPSVCYPKAAED